jgi:hypothetical protein
MGPGTVTAVTDWADTEKPAKPLARKEISTQIGGGRDERSSPVDEFRHTLLVCWFFT